MTECEQTFCEHNDSNGYCELIQEPCAKINEDSGEDR